MLVAILLAGCSDSGIGCSSNGVTDILKNMLTDQMAFANSLGISVDVLLVDIRTISDENRKRVCKANVSFKAKELQNPAQKDLTLGEAQAALDVLGKEVEYTTQRTDEGKIYVELSQQE